MAVFECIKLSLLPTVPSALRKPVRADTNISNDLSQINCINLSKKTKMKIFTILYTISSLMMLIVLVSICINAM